MSHNLEQCRKLVKKAVFAAADVLFLPEASDYIASNAAETVSLCQPVEKSEFVIGLCAEAQKYRLPINVGVHEPAEGGKKVRNTLLWINAEGNITKRYQKLHLFDVEIKDGPMLKESNSVERGTRIEDPFDTVVGKVGMLICFDLRFPEPSIAFATAELSFLPIHPHLRCLQARHTGRSCFVHGQSRLRVMS